LPFVVVFSFLGFVYLKKAFNKQSIWGGNKWTKNMFVKHWKAIILLASILAVIMLVD